MQETTPASDVVIGIDTHKQTHTAVALSAIGAHLGTITIPVSREGYQRLEAWARAFGPVRAFGIEGTGSYGAGLTRSLQTGGYRVLEVNRPDRSARRRKGKDDTIDAEAAARAVLSGQATAEPKSSNSSVEMMRHLKVARDAAVKAKTQAMLTLKAIIITAPEELREQLESIRGKVTLARHLAALQPGPINSTTASQPPRDAGLLCGTKSRSTTAPSKPWSRPPRPTSSLLPALQLQPLPRCCYWSATIPSASDRRELSPSCVAPALYRHPAGEPAATG
jgi:transposase